jgi:hypothetical protein
MIEDDSTEEPVEPVPETKLRNLRTFVLCGVALLGLLGLGCYALKIAAAAALVVAVGLMVCLPLAAWVGGKAWASGMVAIAAVFGRKE